MNDRIRIAEAMGWEWDEEWNAWILLVSKKQRDIVRDPDLLPDPFTDANDDYAVLEWMRSNIDADSPLPMNVKAYRFAELINEMIAFSYKIGDYARAALRVLDND